jgi:hypothetical protein
MTHMDSSAGDSGEVLFLSGGTFKIIGSQLVTFGTGSSVVLEASASLTVVNSLLHGSEATPFFEVKNAGLSVNHTCATSDLSGSGVSNIVLTAPPFEEPSLSKFHFQSPQSECLNLGDDWYADTYTPDWPKGTTVGEVVDESPVDSGYHFDPEEVRIVDLTLNQGSASWATERSRACWFFPTLKDEVYEVPPESVASGWAPHGGQYSETFHLVCRGLDGRMRARHGYAYW